MNKLSKKEISICLSILLFAIIFIFLYSRYDNSKIEEEFELFEDIELEEESEELSGSEVYEKEEIKDIMVHISGQINKPGIIILSTGDRVVDAVELAGGLKIEADIDNINLARILEDEEKIYIPAVGEEIDIIRDVNLNGPENKNQSSSKNDSDLVDINTCSKDELISLPGIGEKTAEKILDYRESNIFSKVEDIMKVSGIGEKKFEGMKDLIIVR